MILPFTLFEVSIPNLSQRSFNLVIWSESPLKQGIRHQSSEGKKLLNYFPYLLWKKNKIATVSLRLFILFYRTLIKKISQPMFFDFVHKNNPWKYHNWPWKFVISLDVVFLSLCWGCSLHPLAGLLSAKLPFK